MTRLVTREMYEQVREMEKRLEAEGKYIDRIDEDGEIYREYVQEETDTTGNGTIRERILMKKKEFIEKRFSKYFDIIGEFESSLEAKFIKMMEENPFNNGFSTEKWIEIPFSCEEEKRFLMEYIAKISPAGIEHAKAEGMQLKINTFIEKKNIRMNLQYYINLQITLDEMM